MIVQTPTATPEQVAAIAREGCDAVIVELRAALKAKTGRAWSVKHGPGTSWGWIYVSSPPARRAGSSVMSAEDSDTLAEALGLNHTPGNRNQAHLVGASEAHRREVLQQVHGLPVEYAEAYWD